LQDFYIYFLISPNESRRRRDFNNNFESSENQGKRDIRRNFRELDSSWQRNTEERIERVTNQSDNEPWRRSGESNTRPSFSGKDDFRNLPDSGDSRNKWTTRDAAPSIDGQSWQRARGSDSNFSSQGNYSNKSFSQQNPASFNSDRNDSNMFNYPRQNSNYNSFNTNLDSDDKFAKSFSKFTKDSPVPKIPEKKEPIILSKSIEENIHIEKLSVGPNSINQEPKKSKKPEKQNKSLLEKEALAEKKRIQEEADAADIVERAHNVEIAKSVISNGLKGTDLKDYLNQLEPKPTPSAFVKAILLSLDEPTSTKWMQESEYGAAIKFLLVEKFNTPEPMRTLYAVQEHCSAHGFPKLEVNGKTIYLIQAIFQQLFKLEIFDETVFLSWADDDADTNGKLTAIVQTTSFISVLREAGNDYDNEEDDEVDAPRQIIK
jgi:hypothetical protein